jgi:hypothetical protein
MHLALGVIHGLMGFNSEQDLRDKVCEPTTTDAGNLFRKFVYPAQLVSLKCEKFTNLAKDGLLDRAIEEWKK